MVLAFIGSCISACVSIATTVISVVKAIEPFVSVVAGIMKGLGMLGPEEEPLELGDKALQAEEQGVTPEQFDSYAEYLKAVESFEADPQKSAAIDENKKLEKGAEVMTAALVEKFNGNIDESFFLQLDKNHDFFAPRLPYYTELSKSDPETFADITRYIEGRESDTLRGEATLGKMLEAEKELDPGANVVDLMKAIDQLKD